MSESEETELKDDDPSLNQPQEKGDQEKESSELFGTQHLEREDSVVFHQQSMVESHKRCLQKPVNEHNNHQLNQDAQYNLEERQA